MSELIQWDDFIIKISEYTGIGKEKITKDTNIFSDLGMDSLGLFSLGMYLIKTYGTKIPLSAVATLETVGDIFEISNKTRNQVVENSSS